MKRLAAVIGDPVAHSKSPALHNAAYAALGIDAMYFAFAVAAGDVGPALHGARALGFMGLNVTVPHKVTALEHCDELDETARLVGAVNTVLCRDGKLWGANTDIDGFGRSLDETLDRPARRAVVLGSGGAARSVVVALYRRGVPCTVFGRDVERARRLLALGAFEVLPWTEGTLLQALRGADLVIDATSAGLSKEAEVRQPSPVPLQAVEKTGLVVSLVYHREAGLLAQARSHGLRTLDGKGMLVHQAARAFELMTGHKAPLAAMWDAMRSDGSHG